jgi:uncharacterized protein YdaU (DUF1376 family)
MAEFPALPLWTDAYLADTTHLTLEQHGAYLKLLIVAWRSPSCSLPADDKIIARYLQISPRRWSAIKPDIMPMFSLSDGKLVQKRLKAERERVTRSRQQRVAAGEASAKARELKAKETESTDVHDLVEPSVDTGDGVPWEQPYPEPEPYKDTTSSNSSTLPESEEDDEDNNDVSRSENNTETEADTGIPESQKSQEPEQGEPTIAIVATAEGQRGEDQTVDQSSNGPESLSSDYSEAHDEQIIKDPARQLMRQRAAEEQPPNLLLEREHIINTIQSFHVSKANAEAIHDGARRTIGRKELVDVIADEKVKGSDRDALQAAIAGVVIKALNESQKTMHSDIGSTNLRTWGKVAEALKFKAGVNDWRAFVKPICVEAVDADSITLRGPKYVTDQIKSTPLGKQIADAWAAESGHGVTVKVMEG